MKILVVGGGGREHAIIKKLRESKRITALFCAPGNGGIETLAQCVNIKATDIDAMLEFAVTKEIDYCVVAPDDPLVLGMVDAFEAKGIPCFGPNKAAAILEGSKAFSKDLMKKYGIPTAKHECFDSAEAAIEYIKSQNTYPTVIKADGLSLGKGVIIATSFDEAQAAVKSIMEDKIFGVSGEKIVIEEFLTGPEVSVLSFCDGKTLVPMVSAMDHKRALDNDKGLNTGGMGSIAPNPYYTSDVAKRCMREIFVPTVEAMNKENRCFKGVIFFGLMITKDGPKVIEYNCRFGDPEAQAVLPLLKSDLLQIFLACTNGTLTADMVEFDEKSAACVVKASGGYPQKYETGKTILGLAPDGQFASGNAYVYHAGTKRDDGEYLTAGGRVAGVTYLDDTLSGAISGAYRAADNLRFEGAHIRNDIGKKALEVLK